MAVRPKDHPRWLGWHERSVEDAICLDPQTPIRQSPQLSCPFASLSPQQACHQDTEKIHDLENVKVLYLNFRDLVVRERSFKSCDSPDRLFQNAYRASIITTEVGKLTVYVREWELSVVRDLEEDLEELRESIVEHGVTEISVAVGRTSWSSQSASSCVDGSCSEGKS